METMVERIDDGATPEYSCKNCGKRMTNRSKMRRHVEVHFEHSETGASAARDQTGEPLTVRVSIDEAGQVGPVRVATLLLKPGGLDFTTTEQPEGSFDMVNFKITRRCGRSAVGGGAAVVVVGVAGWLIVCVVGWLLS